MRHAVVASVIFHVAVVSALFFWRDSLFERDAAMETAVVVDLVEVAPERNLPPEPVAPTPTETEAKPAREPSPAPASDSPPQAVPPPSIPAFEPPPPPPSPPGPQARPESVAEAPVETAAEPEIPAALPPPPLPKPEPSKIAPPPKPKPKPKPEPSVAEAADPEPAAEAEPEPAPAPETPADPPQAEETFDTVVERIAKLKQEQKPAEKADPFASVLKNLEAKRRQAEEDAGASAPERTVAARSDTAFRTDRALTQTQIDAIRQQIQRNWNLPAGARNAENMVVEIVITLAADGSVSDARIIDSENRMQRDPFYRAMAESALRAVMITERIRNLSPETYETWRQMRLRFDPKEMFG